MMNIIGLASSNNNQGGICGNGAEGASTDDEIDEPQNPPPQSPDPAAQQMQRGRRRNTKATPKKSALLLPFTLTCTLMETSKAVAMQTEKVFLKIQLNDGCSLLTPEILHTDVTEMAIYRCKTMYKQHFIDELEHLCPVDHCYSMIDEKGVV